MRLLSRNILNILQNKNYFSVSPLPSMRAILVKAPDELLINGKDLLDYPSKDQADFSNIKFAGYKEPEFKIKIDALLRHFSELQ